MSVLGLDSGYTVSVLGREEGYTAKYGLNPREFPRVQPEGNPEGSGHILPYIPYMPISKSDFLAIFSIALRGRVILEELILRMSLSGRAILHCILPRDYILSYAPCRGSVSWEIHLSKRAILEQLISNISLL